MATVRTVNCPKCGESVDTFKNPKPTVIEMENGIVLIHRKNEPKVWAVPAGFVDYGEPL